MSVRLHPLSLRFTGEDRHLEDAYRRDSFDRNLGYLRICHILSLVAFCSAGVVDFLLFPDHYKLAWTIRFAYAAPVFPIGFALTFTPFYRRYWQLMSFIYVEVTGFASIALFSLMPPPEAHLYFVQIIICYMFGFIFVRLRFLAASLAGITLCAGFTVAVLLFEAPSVAVLSNAALAMLILLLMGIYFSHAYEYADRRDFSLRFAMEREREKTAVMNRILENRVRRRTAELEEEMAGHLQAERDKKDLEGKLGQARKMEAIGSLAGGIAHDFNNILTSVLGYTELAVMECGGRRPLRDYLDQVLIAAGRAAELVRQILTFSRQSEQESKPVSFTAVVAEVTALMRASLPATIRIDSRAEPDVIVRADHIRLHQVLMNLCTNGWQAMQPGGGTLEIDLEKICLAEPALVGDRRIEPGEWARLRVGDSGCGMSDTVIDRIFEPFFTTKEQTEGTGMGLAVVHGIVTGYQGAIGVESHEGAGTTVEVYLPAIEAGDVPVGRRERRAGGGTERILVVDDEASLVRMMTDTLSRLGYTVQGETSSTAALELFAADPDRFDLVITDLTMPGLCGDQLARRLTALRPLPILLCTGFAVGMTAASAREFGIGGILEKPITPTQLANRVRQILDTGAAGNE